MATGFHMTPVLQEFSPKTSVEAQRRPSCSCVMFVPVFVLVGVYGLCNALFQSPLRWESFVRSRMYVFHVVTKRYQVMVAVVL